MAEPSGRTTEGMVWRDGNIEAAQEAFIKRSRLNSLARTGNYHPKWKKISFLIYD
ncbi:MAG: hypothetical protein Ct9H90mP13_01620 [Pseudomonadota bacterium]|nr:MAG: hypothetical protein Ct9H90mP13_01620 [Pseudomonadota bacterium]